MASKHLFFFAFLFFSAVSVFAEDNPGLVMDYYKDTCPQAEEIIKEQVKLLYKRHKNTAFSWLRNIFHDCFVEVPQKKILFLDTLFEEMIIEVLFLCSHVMLHCCWTQQGGCCLRKRQTGVSV